MLQSLSIHHVALIERLDMEFAPGLNVLTGETGAGKSIVIDAVNLVLGERASKELVQYGADKARVDACFTDAGEAVQAILRENGIASDEDLILSRELSAAGKSACRVNGTMVALSTLKSITDKLVDVHGQHAHQALLDPRTHMAFLDACAENRALRDKVAAVSQKYHAYIAENKLESMPQEEREREADLLLYQIREIEAAKLTPSEEETLLQERALLMNAERIMGALEEGYAALHAEGGALQQARSAQQSIQGIQSFSEEYAALNHRLEDAYYALEDAAYGLRDCKNSFRFDEERLDEVENRLDLIAALKRKYGQDIAAVLSYCDKAKAKLEALQNAEARRAALQTALDACKKEYVKAAAALTASRKKAAKALQTAVIGQLAELGMRNAQFEVFFAQADAPRMAEDGDDEVEFLLSANSGEPLKSLSRVASGGELSRIMLAFKTIYADKDAIPTLIFDEIDTGISGKIALTVGEKMVGIADSHQVICVTHLPQIAAFADTHFLVEKRDDGQHTATEVRSLDQPGCIRRLCAMMGGGADSELGNEHARELLEACRVAKAGRKNS